jgi:D-alanine transaminase
MIRDGRVTEGSHANVLAVFDGVIRTHPANHLILHGITRGVVLDIARSLDIPVSEGAITKTELDRVDELFLAGTTTDVMPIVRVDDTPVASGVPGPITTRLVREFRAYLDAACSVAQPTR